jgi:predicted ribosome quality control (RQC) complex YloA/Tae2 family protein
MTFDSVILAAIADELNRKLADGRVDKIHQPEPLDLVFTIRKGSADYSLLISANAEFPRVHLTSIKRPNPKTPPNFCMVLRKYLERGRFLGAEQVDFDRILHLRFAAYDGERFTLTAEIMGKHSNIILVNDTGRILSAVKPIGSRKSRYREVLPGRQYVSPPPQNKTNPLSVTKEDFDGLLADTFPDEAPPVSEIASWLAKSFTGISPFVARELAARSGGDVERLAGEFIGFFAEIRAGDYSPVLLTDDAGRTIGFYPFPSVQFSPSNQHERPSTNAAADVYYAGAIPREEFEHANAELAGRIRKEIDFRDRLVEKIERELAECEGAQRYKQIGELILSQVTSIPEGAPTAELADYYADGKAVAVELDPRLSAAENAEAYFRKYQKALSRAESLKDRRAEINAELRLLRKTLDAAGSVTSQEQVRQLADILASENIEVSRQEAVQEKRKAEFEGHKIARVQADGWEILVGQNSEANDYLLTRVARPTDLWVHVKAVPSAHVIIRTNGKPEAVPKSVLLEAAELAARHSEAKHSSLVPVDYTLRKYVRKPKGAPPGKALYEREKTIFVTPSP